MPKDGCQKIAAVHLTLNAAKNRPKCFQVMYLFCLARSLMSPTVITATLLVASYFRVQFTLSSPAPCEDATYSISNTVLAHHVFITKPSGNIEDCVLHCMGHSLCHSSNYYRQTKLCELNDKTDASNPEDMTEVYGALYMTNGLNPLPCRFLDSECGKLDICSTDSSGNKCKG